MKDKDKSNSLEELKEFEIKNQTKPYVNRISQDKLNAKVKRFIKDGIPYKLTWTHGRTLLVTEKWGSWESRESRFPAKELNFIKSVKQYVLKNKTYRNVRNYFGKPGTIGANKRIKYFHYNKDIPRPSYFEGVWEVDISNCYWDTNYFHYKLISKELYEKGLTVSKKSRLAAIGSYAKVVMSIVFDGVKETKLPDARSEKTEYLWHTICNKIGKTMYKCSKVAKSDFLFFWVDGIFLKNKSQVKAIQKFLKQNGYASTVSYCEWVKFNEKGLIVKSTEKGKWVDEFEKTEILRDGKRFIRTVRKKVFKDERPFPYARALSEKDIINLNSAE
jgi:hypothetical protein